MLINIATACLILGVVVLAIRILFRTSVKVAKALVVVGVVLLVAATLMGMIDPLTT